MTEAFNKTSQKAQRQALRKNMPKAEQVLWSKIKNKQLDGHKFRRQYSVDQYILDFYCPQAKLGIEVDGPSHFRGSGTRSDEKRTLHMESYGIKVVRFTNNEIYENLEGVLNSILDSLTGTGTPEPS
jgi:very-short-patch-repair endonuclease